MDREALKRAAAARAIEEIVDGMVVGLGSGSTAEIAVELLAARGLRIVGVPTSERTAQLARSLGIVLATLDEQPELDLVIDGADQVERGTLNLVKGLGGALLREKLVASAARRMIVMVDDSKLVDRLGGHTPLPVEIVAYGWRSTLGRLERAGLRPTLRRSAEQPFVTDGGNYIADCAIEVIDDAARLERELSGVVGVIESGLFIGIASRVDRGRGPWRGGDRTMSDAGSGPHTLAIDIGGSGLKASVLDAAGQMVVKRVRTPTPSPATPSAVVDTLAGLIKPLPPFDRISIGFPGVVRRGAGDHRAQSRNEGLARLRLCRTKYPSSLESRRGSRTMPRSPASASSKAKAWKW